MRAHAEFVAVGFVVSRVSASGSGKNGDITESITTPGWGTPPGDYWDARYETGETGIRARSRESPMSAGARQRGFCNAIDPFHTWRYTVASDDQSFQLSSVGADPSKTRQLGLEGTWTRFS
jgi:hypothetical protein